MRICKQISTGKLLEMQSDATEGTLVRNAVAAGYQEADVEEAVVTNAEYLALLPKPSAAEIAKATAKQSIDTALEADTTLAQLKAMTNDEFDAWWAANITTAAQAIGVLKRLAKLAIRRLA